MTAEIEQVTRLQSLDERIAALEREVAALPRHVAGIEKALDAHNRRLDADRAALSANQKDRKRLEEDNKVQEQKISKLRDQMLQAKTNEQYRAFQTEITFCETSIRTAEDRILDLMAESEPLEANVKKAETALKKEREHVDAEKAEARRRTDTNKKQLEQLRGERTAIANGISRQLRADYERIRRKWHGSVVAEMLEGRCTGCQISLRPQFLQDLRRGDQLMFCESCGRILFYNPPVSLEHEMATDPRSA